MQRAPVICGIFFSVCLLLFPTAVRGQVPSTAAATEAEASMLMQQALDYEASGNSKRATSTYRRIVKKFPVAASAPSAQFRLAEVLEQSGNLNRAFEAYEKLVQDYPQSKEFNQAIAAQVSIADGYMDRRKFGRAAEMYLSIISSAPYATFAPAAQFKLGQTFESEKEYTKAVAAYQVILDRYLSSDYADDALYQIGYVQLTEAQSRSNDLSAAIDAKNTFEDFLLEYPESEKAAQAQENLDRMTGREASDLMAIAQFYDRNNEYRAAAIYYGDLARRQPGTPDAELATERIEEIRATVGEDELRSGPERAETGERAALRRRLQNQVETSSLSNYAGPPVSAVAPEEELPPPRPRLRTSADDVRPLLPEPSLPSVEPDLPVE